MSLFMLTIDRANRSARIFRLGYDNQVASKRDLATGKRLWASATEHSPQGRAKQSSYYYSRALAMLDAVHSDLLLMLIYFSCA